jgi:hypothetical protein
MNSLNYDLEYATVVSDGDASVEASLREQAPYKIEHLNCCFHIEKVLRNTMYALRQNATAENQKIMIELHKKVVVGVHAAIKHNRETNDVEGLGPNERHGP